MMYEPKKVNKLTPVGDHVLVSDMVFSERRTGAGVIIPGDNGKLHGIHPRWGKVYAVGHLQKDVKVGDWVCVEHGRWTRGIDIEDETGTHTIRRVDPKDIILISDECPNDTTVSEGL